MIPCQHNAQCVCKACVVKPAAEIKFPGKYINAEQDDYSEAKNNQRNTKNMIMNTFSEIAQV